MEAGHVSKKSKLTSSDPKFENENTERKPSVGAARTNVEQTYPDNNCTSTTHPSDQETVKRAENTVSKRGKIRYNESSMDEPELLEMRGKINERERQRMHDLNTAMDSLREVIPYTNSPSVRKLSKIATLQVARSYIVSLVQSLEEMKLLVGDIYRSSSHQRLQDLTRFGISGYGTPPGANTSFPSGLPHLPTQLGVRSAGFHIPGYSQLGCHSIPGPHGIHGALSSHGPIVGSIPTSLYPCCSDQSGQSPVTVSSEVIKDDTH